jgi:hypothetical protein
MGREGLKVGEAGVMLDQAMRRKESGVRENQGS